MKLNPFLILLWCTSFCSIAQTAEWRLKNFNSKKSIALEGYDPVSYFDSKPSEGSEQFRYAHQGIVYLFKSATNLNKFKANPEKYEPAYGGWCAYAMGESGEKVKIDPETYKLLDGKLYLFYNFWGTNTLEDWNEKEARLKEAADQNWKKICPVGG
jgi:YHS domain-containing protein